MKLKLLDEAACMSQRNLRKDIIKNPIPKILGDNLDIFIKGYLGNKDMHLFTSIVVFPRIPCLHLSMIGNNIKDVTSESLALKGDDLNSILQAYSIIIGRMTVGEFAGLEWMKKLLPIHIPHPYSDYMQQRSIVHPLPIQHKNEMKYDDCLDIMDEYERFLIDTHTSVFGE